LSAPAIPARRADWMRRLASWLAEATTRQWAYGRHDCALFAAGAVEAMTGADLAAGWRGRYRTLRGGLRVLRQAGFADHVALAESLLPAVHPAQLMPGDLAVLQGPAGRVLGVVQGQSVYVLEGGGRVALRPLSDCIGGLRL
jgi:hypothetical protein